MLQLRPGCENCNKDLPPSSTEAMICSYECTFCKTCVEEVLQNVCPNCGGGFSPRPIRPKNNLKNNNDIGHNPAVTERKFSPVDIKAHQKFALTIKSIPAHER